jgi:aspartyl-tRNA(Asn)/glutamyl-tRNA(Gln) amidotransferase subunit A
LTAQQGKHDKEMKAELFRYINESSEIGTGEGPLTGKYLVIQPNMSVRSWPTDAGSVALEGFVALEDATVIKRLRAAGAGIKGSSKMSELGFGLAGDTAAQVLSEGLADIVLHTDMMGEPRVAASQTGLFGFKPSQGIVSRFGLAGFIPSMECIGILSRNVEDIIRVMAVITGPDDADYSMSKAQIPDLYETLKTQEPIHKAGVIRECVDSLAPGDAQSFNAVVSGLKQAGLDVREVAFPDFDLFRTAHHVIGSVEASSSCGKFDGVRYGHRSFHAKNWNEMYLRSREESFGLLIKAYIFQGAYFQFENYAAFEDACRIRSRLVHEVKRLFNDIDTLILPTRRSEFNAYESSTVDEVYDAFSLTLPANLTGLPSMNVPPDPGVQLVGPYLGDARLLSMCIQLSEQRGGSK